MLYNIASNANTVCLSACVSVVCGFMSHCVSLCMPMCVCVCMRLYLCMRAYHSSCLQIPPPNRLPCCHTLQPLPPCCSPITPVFRLPVPLVCLMALTPPSLLHPITVTAPKPQCNLLPASSPSLLCPLIPNPLDAPSLPMSWWCSSRLLYTQGAMAVSPMQKLCLVKLVRPECLVAAIQQYVITSLGPRFAEPGPVSLQCVKKDSNNTTPIIFILSPGGPKALSPLIMFCSLGDGGGGCSDGGRGCGMRLQ